MIAQANAVLATLVIIVALIWLMSWLITEAFRIGSERLRARKARESKKAEQTFTVTYLIHTSRIAKIEATEYPCAASVDFVESGGRIARFSVEAPTMLHAIIEANRHGQSIAAALDHVDPPTKGTP